MLKEWIMKLNIKILLTSLFVIISLVLKAQKGDEYIHAGLGYTSDFRSQYIPIHVSYEQFISNRVGFEYSLAFSVLPSGGCYFKLGAGQTLGALVILKAGDFHRNNPLVWLGVLCMIVPEKINITVQETDAMRLQAYISPLTTDFFTRPFGNYQMFELSSEVGIKTRFELTSDFEISPYAGIKPSYMSGCVAFTCGANLSFQID